MFLSYIRQCDDGSARQAQAGTVIFCWLISPLVLGLELGAIDIASGLNEPFRGRIEVLDTADERLDLFSIRLADQEDFQEAGIERGPMLSKLLFTIEEANDGKVHIDIRSQDPINEPRFNFLLEVESETIRFLRGYKVSLSSSESTAHLAPPIVVARRELPRSRAVEPDLTEMSASNMSRTVGPGSYVPGRAVGPIAASDTLWSIATKYRPNARVTVHQMMLALLQGNRGAFSNGNVNLLRRGVILRLPEPSRIEMMSVAKALSEVKRQNDEWEDRRTHERPITQSSGVLAESSSLPKIASVKTSEAYLELVVPGSEIGDEITARPGEGADLLREELDAVFQQKDELQAKLGEAEEIIDLLQRQVTIKDKELAALQHRLTEVSGDEEVIRDDDHGRPVGQDSKWRSAISFLNTRLPEEFTSIVPGGAVTLLGVVFLGLAGWCAIVVHFLVRGRDSGGVSINPDTEGQVKDGELATRPSGGTEESEMDGEVLIEDVADFKFTLNTATDLEETVAGDSLDPVTNGGSETRVAVDEYVSLNDLGGDDFFLDDESLELERSGADAKNAFVDKPEQTGLESSSDDLDTKLDLAKAYIELGDEKGARSILDEVSARGNDAQKVEAGSLLEQLYD